MSGGSLVKFPNRTFRVLEWKSTGDVEELFQIITPTGHVWVVTDMGLAVKTVKTSFRMAASIAAPWRRPMVVGICDSQDPKQKYEYLVYEKPPF